MVIVYKYFTSQHHNIHQIVGDLLCFALYNKMLVVFGWYHEPIKFLMLRQWYYYFCGCCCCIFSYWSSSLMRSSSCFSYCLVASSSALNCCLSFCTSLGRRIFTPGSGVLRIPKPNPAPTAQPPKQDQYIRVQKGTCLSFRVVEALFFPLTESTKRACPEWRDTQSTKSSPTRRHNLNPSCL